MDVSNDPRHPNTGDIIGCSDGDIGIVLECYYDDYDCIHLIEVAWSSGKIMTDPWNAEDFETADDMFHIMSRA